MILTQTQIRDSKMNILNRSFLATIFSLSVLSVSAATTQDNINDSIAIGRSDTPQIKEQIKNAHTDANKSTSIKNHVIVSNKKMKMMDTNLKILVSKKNNLLFKKKPLKI